MLNSCDWGIIEIVILIQNINRNNGDITVKELLTEKVRFYDVAIDISVDYHNLGIYVNDKVIDLNIEVQDYNGMCVVEMVS